MKEVSWMDHAELLNESKQAATTLKSQLVSRRSWWMKNGKVRAGAYCDGAEPPKEEGEKKAHDADRAH